MGHRNSGILALCCLLLSLLCGGAMVKAQSHKEANIQLLGFKPPVVQGEPGILKAAGKSFPLQSVQITLPEDISIRDIKEIQPEPGQREVWGDKARFWSITVFVDRTAKLGERTVVLVTPYGSSAPNTIRVVSHVPKISDLRILSAKGQDSSMEITFLASGAELGSKSVIVWTLSCDVGGAFQIDPLAKYARKDAQTTLITANLASRGSRSTGTCELKIAISDENSLESNELKTKVRFQ